MQHRIVPARSTAPQSLYSAHLRESPRTATRLECSPSTTSPIITAAASTYALSAICGRFPRYARITIHLLYISGERSELWHELSVCERSRHQHSTRTTKSGPPAPYPPHAPFRAAPSNSSPPANMLLPPGASSPKRSYRLPGISANPDLRIDLNLSKKRESGTTPPCAALRRAQTHQSFPCSAGTQSNSCSRRLPGSPHSPGGTSPPPCAHPPAPRSTASSPPPPPVTRHTSESTKAARRPFPAQIHNQIIEFAPLDAAQKLLASRCAASDRAHTSGRSPGFNKPIEIIFNPCASTGMIVFSFTARGCSFVPSITGTFGPYTSAVQQTHSRALRLQCQRQIHGDRGLAHGTPLPLATATKFFTPAIGGFFSKHWCVWWCSRSRRHVVPFDGERNQSIPRSKYESAMINRRRAPSKARSRHQKQTNW